jgi:cytochrome P450
MPSPVLWKGVLLIGSGTEGSIWRHHRKISSPPFTEKNNVLVFKESIRQAQSMVTSWVDGPDEKQKTFHHIAEDTMRLSLHVISRAGFGQSLKWPHEETEGTTIPAGHTLTYKDALGNLLENIIQVMLMPKVVLSE